LAQRIGAGPALALQSASRPFSADEAVKLGFIDRVAEASAWQGLIDENCAQETLDPAAKALLKACVTPDTRAADLALLAQSASVPGLKARIRAFRESPG
jgi:enoyl-CoA hydratase/carnithine racemase